MQRLKASSLLKFFPKKNKYNNGKMVNREITVADLFLLMLKKAVIPEMPEDKINDGNPNKETDEITAM